MAWKISASQLGKSLVAVGVAHHLRPSRQSQGSKCDSSMTFGIIADVQYADTDGGGRRNFRNSLKVVQNARTWWSNYDLSFVVHAGDLIDERQSQRGPDASEKAFHAVAKEFPHNKDVVCLIGNHELYNFSREELKALSLRGPLQFVNATGSFYYRYEPAEAINAGWRFLVLDSFDRSLMSQGRGHDMDQSALSQIATHNPNFKIAVGKAHATIHDVNNECIDGVKFEWFGGLGKRDLPWRWNPVNGAISQDQLLWLKTELEEATYLGLKVGLIAHVGLHPNTGMGGQCLTWNYDEVLNLLHGPSGACVQFVFNGHRHDGGFATDDCGIHHCTFESPLHSSPDEPGCFAVVELRADQMVIKGYAPGPETVHNQGYGRVLDAKDAFALQTRELPLRCSKTA